MILQCSSCGRYIGDEGTEWHNNNCFKKSEVKEKDMTILEKLEELKSRYSQLMDGGFMDMNREVVLGLEKAIQIVKDSLPTEKQIYIFNGNNDGSYLLVNQLRDLGLLQQSTKRYKWTNGKVTTNETYTQEEFKEQYIFGKVTKEHWIPVDEEV
jgi:hypothetical protein